MRGSQSPPVITTVMSPTLKKTLDAKLDIGSLEAFKKQVVAEVSALLSQPNMARALGGPKSRDSHSRNGSLSRS